MSPDVPAATTSEPDIEILTQVRDIALGVSGVVALHSGALGEVATYLPGSRLEGVRFRDKTIDIHIVTRLGSPLLDIADAVRVAVERQVPYGTHVIVEDVVED